MLFPGLSSGSCRRAMAVVSLGLLFVVAMSQRAEATSSDPPDVFRWDQVPITCAIHADCPTDSLCYLGTCRYPCQSTADCDARWPGYASTCTANWCQATGHDVDPPTINYLGPSYRQIGGLCWIWSKFHAFQARVAIEVDRNDWYDWGRDDLDRSIPLSISPFWQCSAGDFMRFTEAAGLVDACFDTIQDGWFEPEPCGYYQRYMVPAALIAQGPCSAPQEQQSQVLSFRAGDWVELVDFVSYEWLADLIYRDGPPAIHVPEQRHNISVIGYDFRTEPHQICFQNSWADDEAIFCAAVDTSWTRFGKMDYPVDIETPVPFDPVSLSPFVDWIVHDDKDGDGVPASADRDQDGDEAYDIFDPLPFNPYLRVDTDGDGYYEPRLSGQNQIEREEVCLAFCESLDQLTYLQAAHPEWQVSGANRGGQVCRERCLYWDRCITYAIKNVGDDQCNWTCLSPRNDAPICNYEYTDTRADCCTPAQLDNLENTCRPIYYNVSNFDSDGPARDPDQIADVCEEGAVVSGLDLRLDSFSYMRAEEEGPFGLQISWLEVCRSSAAQVTFGLFGGATWETGESGERVRITDTATIERLGEVGSCGCDAPGDDWAACISAGGPCSEAVDWRPGDLSYQAWEDIEAPECTAFDWLFPHPDPVDENLCEDKRLVHGGDDDCSDGDCDIYELSWHWTQHAAGSTLLTLPGETVKVRVGERQLDQDWHQNRLTVNPEALTLPDPAVECWIPAIEGLADWIYVDLPHEPPHEWPLGVGPVALGTWGLGRDPLSQELHLFEFDRQMRGPLNPTSLTYGGDGVPRIGGSLLAVAAPVEAHLVDRDGEGVPMLFILGREQTGHSLSQARLWVVDLEMGEIWLAENLFGPSGEAPPPMVAPVALYDTTNSRLVVAGGGETQQFGIWAYTPLTGQWRELQTTLPQDLRGFSLVEDSARHRLLLLGGSIGDSEQAQLLVVSMLDGSVAKGPKPPEALGRAGHATGIDSWGRTLYLFGGRQGDQVLGDLWAMDLETWAWTPLDDGLGGDGPGAREGAHIFWERHHGKLWVTGGHDASGPKLPTLWGYSPADGGWEERPLGGKLRVYLPLVLRQSP